MELESLDLLKSHIIEAMLMNREYKVGGMYLEDAMLR
jgi:hypothetical protein